MPSKTHLLALAKCSVQRLKNCNSTITNVYSLFDWLDYWPQIAVSKQPNGLINFLESLRNDSPPVATSNFSHLYADWSATSLSVRTYYGDQDEAGLVLCNSSRHDQVILNTTNLIVEGTWGVNGDFGCSLLNVNMTTRFPSSPVQTLTQRFNVRNPDFSKNKWFKLIFVFWLINNVNNFIYYYCLLKGSI